MENSFQRIDSFDCDPNLPYVVLAKELLPSAYTAYGRPVIGHTEGTGISFGWKEMYWRIKNDKIRCILISKTLFENCVFSFSKLELEDFIKDHTKTPKGLPEPHNISEFD